PSSVSSVSLQTGNTDGEQAESRHGETLQESGRSSGQSPDSKGAPDDNQHDAKGSEAGENAQNRQLEDPWNLPSGSDGSIAGAGSDEIIHGASFIGLPPAIYYDEWDETHRVYIKRGAAVRLYEPEVGDERWPRDTLGRHAAVVRRIRQEFERLRARR